MRFTKAHIHEKIFSVPCPNCDLQITCSFEEKTEILFLVLGGGIQCLCLISNNQIFIKASPRLNIKTT